MVNTLRNSVKKCCYFLNFSLKRWSLISSSLFLRLLPLKLALIPFICSSITKVSSIKDLQSWLLSLENSIVLTLHSAKAINFFKISFFFLLPAIVSGSVFPLLISLHSHIAPKLSWYLF